MTQLAHERVSDREIYSSNSSTSNYTKKKKRKRYV